MSSKKVIIIGGGAAALMAAEILSANCEVHIYEKGKTIGRKFLVAGKGGFNLTNAAVGDDLYNNYPSILHAALANFDSTATRTWLSNLDIPTFVGSSGRVFPKKGIKPIQVLNKIKNRLIESGVQFHYLHEFIGFNEAKHPIVVHDEGTKQTLEADYYIFALGGASWSVTGSNITWKASFDQIGIKTVPFQPSNCGINIDWPEDFKAKFAGSPIKNIQVSIGQKMIKGEVLITDYGLEGNAIYPIIPAVRYSLKMEKNTAISIDLKPHNTHQNLLSKTKGKRIRTKNYTFEFKLSKAQLALAKQFSNKEEYISPERFIEVMKKVKIPVQSLRPIEEAISTVGGISLEAIEDDFSLKDFPTIFVIGEMLDWDAPTGGFLLQGCFSTAVVAAKSILKKGINL
jgi:uncharacterized flavoprotein (TIGR03862 family)